MMNSNFSDSAIRAIHRVITRTRTQAYFNTDPQVLARMLDYADPLGFVLMAHFPVDSEQERIGLFRQRLQDLEETFQGFEGLVAGFDEDMERGKPAEEKTPGSVRELTALSA